MLYAKFQEQRTISSEEDFKSFTINGHVGHLGHVTLIFYTNFSPPSKRKLQIKSGFNWPSSFREEDV